VIISTNRGEPLVLQKTITLAGVAFEEAARRLVGLPPFAEETERGGWWRRLWG
jgi:septum site-determining protein MinD